LGILHDRKRRLDYADVSGSFTLILLGAVSLNKERYK